MGITNGAATIPGFVGPQIVGVLTNNRVCIDIDILIFGMQMKYDFQQNAQMPQVQCVECNEHVAQLAQRLQFDISERLCG